MRTVQLTLDEPLVEEVDEVAKRLGTSRSAFTRSVTSRVFRYAVASGRAERDQAADLLDFRLDLAHVRETLFDFHPAFVGVDADCRRIDATRQDRRLVVSLEFHAQCLWNGQSAFRIHVVCEATARHWWDPDFLSS